MYEPETYVIGLISFKIKCFYRW